MRINLTKKEIKFESIKNHDHLKINSKINKIEILFKKFEKTND